MASGLDPHIRDVFLRNDRDTWEQDGLVMKKFNTSPLSSDLPKTDDKQLQWNKSTEEDKTIWLWPDPLTW